MFKDIIKSYYITPYGIINFETISFIMIVKKLGTNKTEIRINMNFNDNTNYLKFDPDVDTFIEELIEKFIEFISSQSSVKNFYRTEKIIIPFNSIYYVDFKKTENINDHTNMMLLVKGSPALSVNISKENETEFIMDYVKWLNNNSLNASKTS